MPGMGLVGEHLPLCGKDVKRRNSVIVDRRRFPAITVDGPAHCRSVGKLDRGHSLQRLQPFDIRRCLNSVHQGGRGLGSGRHGRQVLCLQQVLRLCGPGHEFRIEQNPVRLKFAPQSGCFHGLPDAGDNSRFLLVILEERTAGSGVNYPRLAVFDTEPARGSIVIPGNDQEGPRAHVFFFRNEIYRSALDIMFYRLFRVFQKRPLGRSRACGHCGR